MPASAKPAKSAKLTKSTRGRLCNHPECGVAPSFGTVRGYYVHCMHHRKPWEFDTRNRQCAADGCTTQPSFGLPGTTVREYCSRHAVPGVHENLRNFNQTANRRATRVSLGAQRAVLEMTRDALLQQARAAAVGPLPPPVTERASRSATRLRARARQIDVRATRRWQRDMQEQDERDFLRSLRDGNVQQRRQSPAATAAPVDWGHPGGDPLPFGDTLPFSDTLPFGDTLLFGSVLLGSDATQLLTELDGTSPLVELPPFVLDALL